MVLLYFLCHDTYIHTSFIIFPSTRLFKDNYKKVLLSSRARLLFSGVDVLFRVSLGLRFFPVMLLIIKIVEFLIGALSYHRNSIPK